jgi:glycosyltransferase involved in cell wall biosynthesis
MQKSKDLLYSLIIPTYNEKENISILVYLIDKHMNEKYILLNKKKIFFKI